MCCDHSFKHVSWPNPFCGGDALRCDRQQLDFCRKGRIAMCVDRWIWLPAGALRARPAICGALGRASVNSDAANQRSPNPCRPFPSRSPVTLRAPHPKREAPNQTGRPGARSRLPRPPPRNRRGLLKSKAERVAAGKTPVKIDQPQVERVTKQERVLTLLPTGGGQHRRNDAGDRLAAAQAALCSLPCRMVKRRPQAIRLSIMSEFAESGPSAAPTCHPRSWRGRAFSTIAAKRIRFDC